MSVTKFRKSKATANTGDQRYIEVGADGRVYITTSPVAASGASNPLATAENFRRLAPQAAAQLRAEGASRRTGTANNSETAREAAAGERERIRAILAHPHAKGRERLAEQLALTEGMTVERAGEILSTAPVSNAFDAIAADPDEQARDAAERAVKAARDGGLIR